MTGMERHGSHKRGRKTAARIGNHKDVVAEVSAIRRREEKESSCVQASRKDGRTEKQKKQKAGFKHSSLGGLGLGDP